MLKKTAKRLASLALALTVALTGTFGAGMTTQASAKTTVSKTKVNIAAPKKVSAKLSTAKGGYDDVVVSWSKTPKAKGYYVYYKKDSKKTKWQYAGRTTKTYLTKRNLTDGTKYVFLVKPYKQKGNKIYKSKNYKKVEIRTLKKISTPTVKKYSSGNAKVYWKDIAGQDGYQISRSTSKNKTNVVYTYKTTKGKSKVLSAKNNKIYYYKVRAFKYSKVKGKIKRVYAPWSNVKAYKVKVANKPSNKDGYYVPIYRPTKPGGCGNTHDGYKPPYGGWTYDLDQLDEWGYAYYESLNHGGTWGFHEYPYCGKYALYPHNDFD